MNLMEKYRRKFELTVKQGNQIMAPLLTNELTEDVKEAYEERAGIMQYDGGLSKEGAEKYGWCFQVCMLTEPMSKLCERMNPCPKWN